MEHQEILDRLSQLIQDLRGENLVVTPELSLQEDLGADSVELMELIVSIEDSFHIEISDEATDHLATVQDVVELIQTLQKS